MWAGGEIEWSNAHHLRIGQEASEETRVRSVEAKRGKGKGKGGEGEDMLVVGVEKRYSISGEDGCVVLDRR